MSNIFGKIFKKKEEDFSFDSSDSFSESQDSKLFSDDKSSLDFSSNDDFGTQNMNLDQHTNQLSDPIGTSDPLATPAGTPDPFATPHQNNLNMPMTNQTNPLPPFEKGLDNMPTSTGSQIAQNYINKQRTTPQPINHVENTPQQTHSLEMINLKLDAIKSQLETLNQRIQKMENEPKKLWR